MKDDIVMLDKWEFNESVTNCFENMLERSIPEYNTMRNIVFNLGCEIIDKSIKNNEVANILDIGCSNGLSLESFINKYGLFAKYKGIDISPPMIKQARCRFENYIDCGVVNIENIDLRRDFPEGAYNLITSILTVQFTPIEYRQGIIKNIYDGLTNNGAFIMVEKVLGNSNEINNIMINTYLKMKKDNGYTEEQIEKKRTSLEGVLVPLTSNWNIDLLKQAGFKKVDVFWRWMNFEGYIAIK